MCGIACAIRSSDPAEVARMSEKIAHRGPDGVGLLADADNALAHRRLAILDPKGGVQPWATPSGGVLIYNGEIYNHLGLRSQMPDRTFQTRCDTETLAAALENWGADAVEKLDGMFAFVYVDGERYIAARDPVGIKPLFRADRNGATIFASEFKAFDDQCTNIEDVPAGTVIDSETGAKQFYFVPKPEPRAMSMETAADAVRSILYRAVSKRMLSDVPVGVFLSGGLDSAIIAAIAVRLNPDTMAFSVGFHDSQDAAAAQEVAAALGMRHCHVSLSAGKLVEMLPKVIYHLESFDAPLVRSALANYAVSEMARDHIKVALTGEGADELFAGYDYLREFSGVGLDEKLRSLVLELQNTNLQRTDRMTMAHGIEGRVPFLDKEMIALAFQLPVELKLSPAGVSKAVLRMAFRDMLPDWAVNRPKQEFGRGTGVAEVMAKHAAIAITDDEFEANRFVSSGLPLRDKEELIYYRVWRSFFRPELTALVGRSRKEEIE